MTTPEPTTTTIETADGPMPAHLWRPEGGSGPGLVLVQEIFGVSGYIRRRAQDLAELGYVVLAPEVYWRLDTQVIDPDAGDELEQALGLAQQVDWDTAVADVAAALVHLQGMVEVTGGAGLIGFCFGGGLAFNVAAVTEPAVLVSYYGSALPSLTGLAPQVRTPSLHHFGLEDSYVDVAAQEAIRTAVEPQGAQVETYAGAGHAFDNPNPMFFHAQASEAAWRRTVAFLAERLPVGGRTTA
ncbi:MAG: dienelactone hydrolase family protein [Friedmanniella sp.]|nr:dienelactone hydrolase family protein [Friedmanniella sp.]